MKTLPIESTNVKLLSGNKIARGIPGNPPPVPMPRMSEDLLNEINFEIAIECKTCLS